MRARSGISAWTTPRTQTAFVFSVPICFANFSGRIPLHGNLRLGFERRAFFNGSHGGAATQF
jgi:hypothetical protein